MKLDLQALIESGKALEVAKLTSSVGMFDKIHSVNISEYDGIHILDGYYRQYDCVIKKSGQVEVHYHNPEKEGYTHVCVNNIVQIIQLLHPFDLDDRIDMFREYLTKELGFEKNGSGFIFSGEELFEIVLFNNSTWEIFYEKFAKRWTIYSGKYPTSKSFCRQLLASLGIQPKGIGNG